MIFYFNNFFLRQGNEIFKICTDSILLGSWINLKNEKTILDIGAGTGVLGFMLAQKTEAKLFFVEKNEDAIKILEENLKTIPFKNQFEIIGKDFFSTSFNTNFDFIISNPPYFANSIKNKLQNISEARHHINFGFELFFKRSFEITSKNGSLAIVIPYSIFNSVLIKAFASGFYLSRFCKVYHDKKSSVSIVLIEFVKDYKKTIEEKIILTHDNKPSEDYINLTKDYIVLN